MIDALGRRVAQAAAGTYAAGTHEVALPTDGLPPGAYTVRLTTEAGTAVRRLTVAR